MISEFIEKNGIDDRKALLDYTVNVVQTMSQASASYAADWYEAIAKLQKMSIPDAVMAELPTYGEIAKTVNGIMKRSLNTDAIASAASALTKRAAADTTLQNAKRDGAEFAWIPVGDTCPYCLELASFGWRPATDNTVKGNHAEHIHANCDCEFAIRFGDDLSYSSYNPDKYKEMFDNADGRTLDEKVNSIRRMKYAENPEKYREQSNRAYRLRTGSLSSDEYAKAVELWDRYSEVPNIQNREYIISQFDTWLTPEEKSKCVVSMEIDNYRYFAVTKGHNEYKIYHMEPVTKGIDWLDDVLTEVIGKDWRKYDI